MDGQADMASAWSVLRAAEAWRIPNGVYQDTVKYYSWEGGGSKDEV